MKSKRVCDRIKKSCVLSSLQTVFYFGLGTVNCQAAYTDIFDVDRCRTPNIAREVTTSFSLTLSSSFSLTFSPSYLQSPSAKKKRSKAGTQLVPPEMKPPVVVRSLFICADLHTVSPRQFRCRIPACRRRSTALGMEARRRIPSWTGQRFWFFAKFFPNLKFKLTFQRRFSYHLPSNIVDFCSFEEVAQPL